MGKCNSLICSIMENDIDCDMEKRVLLICPRFYGYDQKIVKALEDKGWHVYYKNEVPFNSPNLYNYLIRLLPFFKGFLWSLYERELYKMVSRFKPQNALIIRGYNLPERIVRRLSDDFGLIITCYQWDSTNNNPNALVLSRYSERVFTFDLQDSIKYNFSYLPLFYDWSDVSLFREVETDVLFIASWSEQRLAMAETLRSLCEKERMSYFIYLYIPFMTFLKRLIKRQKCLIRGLHIKPMSRNKYASVLNKTKVVVDMPSPSQVGASMRTIEALSKKKKLLTTNHNVVNELFYNESNVRFFESITANDIRQLLNSPFDEKSVEDLYSLSSWLSFMGY